MFQKNLKNYCSVREYWTKKRDADTSVNMKIKIPRDFVNCKLLTLRNPNENQ